MRRKDPSTLIGGQDQIATIGRLAAASHGRAWTDGRRALGRNGRCPRREIWADAIALKLFMLCGRVRIIEQPAVCGPVFGQSDDDAMDGSDTARLIPPTEGAVGKFDVPPKPVQKMGPEQRHLFP